MRVHPGEAKKRRAAVVANLMAQLRRSPELTRLVILLVIWGHVRARPGYRTMSQRSIRPGRKGKTGQRRKGFSLKRPRERFL
jgi:hypothetical protein